MRFGLFGSASDGRAFDPMDVGIARAFYVAKDKADKDAAFERRLEAQRYFARELMPAFADGARVRVVG